MKINLKEVVEKLKSGEQKICVIGLGRIGLPTACLFAKAKASVIGVDKNLKNVKLISEGKTPFQEKGLQPLLEKVIKTGKLQVSSNLKEEIPKSDVIIILVSTLIDNQKNPDYGELEKVCKDIGLTLKKDSLIIFESTVGPGFTENFALKTIEHLSGFKVGKDFGLAYSPIRASPGRILRDLTFYPRIVAGIDKASLNRACAVLSLIVKNRFIVLDSIKAAEAAKVFENVYRDVNIALANVLASFCEEAGLNYKKIAEAANTQPYCHLLRPGIVGGTCIPVTPYFLLFEAKNLGLSLEIVETARKVNEAVAKRIVDKISEAFKKDGLKLRRSKIFILGVSYKADSRGEYLAPCKGLMEILKRKGAEIFVWDPLYTVGELKEIGLPPVRFEDGLRKANCIIISVGHMMFKNLKRKILENLLMRKEKIFVVDASGFNIFTPKDSVDNVKCLSIGYWKT